ncbi:hypothetical protein UFOVP1419_52 [uncultured Caudovirales phage]|uniref:Uncharacterized protein n=1 Tax=uncultured Caudovirales phage TaxID=2100421 RepID=A0A6J5SDX8_9CAUD|nr:hypothetical protein UFOVP1419_52 [uncultured Caudovirales phage]
MKETDQIMGEMMSVVRFGIEAEAFLASPLGKYLQQRVDAEVVEAVNSLKTVDPCDHAQIVKLQNEIYRAESFSAWLADLITSGWEAEKEIRMMEGNL